MVAFTDRHASIVPYNTTLLLFSVVVYVRSVAFVGTAAAAAAVTAAPNSTRFRSLNSISIFMTGKIKKKAELE